MPYSSSKWNHPRRWQQSPVALRHASLRALRSWLVETGSLTARLQALAMAQGQTLRVQVMSEGWGLPCAEEARTLRIGQGEYAWIREVVLLSAEVPWVHARSILPRTSLNGLNRRLTRLGNQSLGSVLFRDPDLIRGPLRYARITAPVLAEVAAPTSQPLIWARRSRFRLRGQAILVAEAFLPALLTASATTDTIAS